MSDGDARAESAGSDTLGESAGGDTRDESSDALAESAGSDTLGEGAGSDTRDESSDTRDESGDAFGEGTDGDTREESSDALGEGAGSDTRAESSDTLAEGADSDALERLSTQELHDRALHHAERHLDVKFFWRLLSEIPAAQSLSGDEGEAEYDTQFLKGLLSDALRSGHGKLREALRPVYIDYLRRHPDA